ncbi:uncharacterized protein (DUF934 family) [Angulomicrobium tetraedrale]|uniref:Uncharacterized protein (DUF934 family) n=1 Tax=Ancylobacter tetraedralis TaxID=217068 RepID=A0A839Z8A6_9HYPH|nr:DUF934 domain-containing protein [Ancylobacter tetraedralis]MBB3771070.1 uncharacterized protein (DUF934 family) [Ancylobacter tetraedralis]
MRLIENGKLVEDRFARVPDDEALPEGAPVLIGIERFLRDAEALKDWPAPVGVIWPNNRPIAEIAPYLPQIALIALNFPSFRDGRAYSQARLLRERLGWAGPLRAVGNVLQDQFLLMQRSGFDQIQPVKAADADAFDEAVHRYTVFYQPATDRRPSLLRQRLGRSVSGVAE